MSVLREREDLATSMTSKSERERVRLVAQHETAREREREMEEGAREVGHA